VRPFATEKAWRGFSDHAGPSGNVALRPAESAYGPCCITRATLRWLTDGGRVAHRRHVVSNREESLLIGAAERGPTRRAAPALDLPVAAYPAACVAPRRFIANPSN